ncbi:hypothetical protein JRQ81_005433 [Phrynocephalus forsythii]|uniref:Uncharacterized protein n=1 Tax=Phrynocephalus forsythii TaxID=171643 RepID=A0A9Q0Y5G9_9SAUR|nr:hypothetical protein JRQ81_005433 [Phrynocephalus forsythii]
MLRLVRRLSQGAVGMLEASQDEDQPHQARGQRLFPWWWRTAKVFHVQIRIAGKTSGAEKNFLKNVSKLLSHQRVSLRVKEFTETSKDPLLVFCPISSSMANNIEIALKGLRAGQKAILVLMHYVQRDNTGTHVDAMKQVKCADVILTVHTRYTLQEGFYPCVMNEVAVADVASALKDLA